MTIIQPNEVFELVGCSDDQRETHLNKVTDLIQQFERQLISELGRSVESVTLSSQPLLEHKNFEFSNDYQRILLKGDYRDLYSITALTHEGSALTESVSYNDGNDYVFDPVNAVIEKLSGTWSTSRFAIVISGKYGYVDQSTDKVREDIKELLKEAVAIKSGLYKTTFISDGGDVTVSKDKVDKWFSNRIMGHRNISLI